MKHLLFSIFLLLLQACTNKIQQDETKVAYLVAYMTGDDEKHMYYAVATENFKFRILNNGNPILAATYNDQLLRDPMIICDQQGIYHLVATVSWSNQPFTVWDSNDLIIWENERLVNVAPQGATKTWAPEFTFDQENNIYFVHWTAELNHDWNTAAIYYSTTKDFVNFSEPRILYSEEGGILDANIIKADGLYHLIYRKNGIWVVTSENAQGPYSNPTLLTPENVEGPYAFPLKEGTGYGIVWDYFGASLGFGLWISPDFQNWIKITNDTYPYYNDQVEFPDKIRHGSIIPLTQTELNLLLKHY